MRTKQIALTSLMLLIGSASAALATNGDSMLGLTALQWARGGAVVAAPVDVPSMMYNPAAAGEIKIDKAGFDMSVGVLGASRSINTSESGSDNYLAMGVGSVAKLTDRLSLGLVAGGVAGLGVDFPASGATVNASVVSTKSLFKVSPTLAYAITDKLTVGVAPQLGYQSLALKTPAFALPQVGEFGIGASLGAIYHLTPQLQAGLAYTSKMNVHEYTFNGTVNGTNGTTTTDKYTMKMDVPQTVAGGIAYRPMSGLLLEADIKWIDYSSTMDRVDLRNSSGATTQTLAFGWSDQTVYSIAAEYEAFKGITFRAAYNYGKSPIESEDVSGNFGSIAVIEHHASVGLTKQWNSAIATSVSYTHGFENTVSNATHKITASQDIAYLQLSYRF